MTCETTKNTLSDYAWYMDNAWNVDEQYAHAVGTAGATLGNPFNSSNPWGLYDMHGNVYEWVQDWFGAYESGPQEDPQGPDAGSYRVIRGGAFPYGAWDTRSANRGDGGSTSDRLDFVGARLLMIK